MRMTASWFRSHVDRPNTRVWRDDPRPMASSPLIVDARLSPSNLSSSLRAGSDDGTRAATGIFGRRDRANRAAVPSVHIAMLTRLIRMEAKLLRQGPERWQWSGREPSRPKSLDIRRPIQGWLDEGGDVEPLVAVVAEGDRPLTFGRPDPAQDRLQANAVLVRGPDLDRRVRVLGPRLGDGLLQLFLNALRSSGVPEAGWRGRGFCTDQSIALSASQPRWGKTAASPSSLAIQAATLRLDHRPPSGGGWVKRARKRARSSGRSTLGTPAARPHCAGAGRPAHQDLSRCSGRAVARSSAARSSSPPRRPRSCDPALTARSPERAASRSDPGLTGTPLPDPRRSDDQQPAP